MTTRDKKMLSGIELDNGRTFYFCGTRCMLKAWLYPKVYLGVKDAKVRRAVVTEFFTGAYVDAKNVNWVMGSDVVGPMGPMIVPLLGDEALLTFKERHGGSITFRLGELNASKWEAMTGKKHGKNGSRK
jgi:nitrous oxide reductase accessory protein NosL